MMLAGLDGIKNKIEPPSPIDKDLYELPPDEAAAVPQVPSNLDEVLNALEADHAYLLEGGVFTPDLIETWIDYKRSNEIDAIRLRPPPHEFAVSFDAYPPDPDVRKERGSPAPSSMSNHRLGPPPTQRPIRAQGPSVDRAVYGCQPVSRKSTASGNSAYQVAVSWPPGGCAVVTVRWYWCRRV